MNELSNSIPKLFLLPPELLAKISFYCFKEFRTACKFMKDCAFPWTSFDVIDKAGNLFTVYPIKKTLANALILEVNLSKILSDSSFSIGNMDRAFSFACRTGNLQLAKKVSKFLIRHKIEMHRTIFDDKFSPHTNIDRGLYYACKYNHLKVAKFCKRIGATNFTYGLMYACYYGNLDLAIFCKNSGATHFDYALLYACNGNEMDLVKFCIKSGATNINDCFERACFEGYLELAKFCKEAGATKFDKGLKSACLKGHLELVKLCIEYGAVNFHESLCSAQSNVQFKVIDYLLSLDHVCITLPENYDYREC